MGDFWLALLVGGVVIVGVVWRSVETQTARKRALAALRRRNAHGGKAE